jgi:dTDP-4-amino-4,6-dideoxygalactose transaminase
MIPFTGLKKQYNDLRQELLDVTDKVLSSGQLMNGAWTAEFENWLARKNHTKYAVTCHSATGALECIAAFYIDRSRGLPTPPRALIPSFTYAATANAFIRAGWDVHFADCDRYGIVNLDSIPINSSYQALVLVGLYGACISHISDTRRWREVVRQDYIIVEDAAQHWLADDGIRIGQAAAISFDPMKNLPAIGNGGAIVTNDSDLFHYACAWRDNGKSDHVFVGTNNRMSELDCAHLMVKTQYIDQWQMRRHIIAEYWMERLQDVGARCLIDQHNISGHAIHKFVIDCDNRDLLRKKLQAQGIETRVHYTYPLHELGVFRQYPGPDILSLASSLSRRVLSLPIYPELDDSEVEYIVTTIQDLL